MKRLIICGLMLLPVLCAAQYRGGINDGVSSINAAQQNALPPIYSGGSNDGVSNYLSPLQNALPAIYKGGNDDGAATSLALNQNALPSIYLGGDNDGVAVMLATGQNSTPSIYTGGTDDGVSATTALNQNALPSIYVGGVNDGAASLLSAAQNSLPSIYKGGTDDGYANTLVLKMNPSDALKPLCLNVRTYLEGALINNNNATAPDGRPLMRDNLRQSPFTGRNYIPVKNPYEFATAYVDVTGIYTKLVPQDAAHPSLRQVTDSAVVFGVSGQNAIVDWVFVELRDKANKNTVAATRAALLQRDGDVVEVDGQSCLSFPDVAIDSYYVAVRHRTHFGAMTKFAQSQDSLQRMVDFTLPATPVYDRGVVGSFNYTGLALNDNVISGYRAMWQGDFNQDGKVKYDNPDDDLSVLLFEVLFEPGNSTFASNYDFAYGYWQGDYDMNSKAKYDTPDDDNALMLFQVLFCTQNSQFASNFDFMLQQLP